MLGHLYDGIEFRGFAQETVEELAAHAGVPVWNGLTDQWHPTQMLADVLTIRELLGRPARRHLAYVGDGRNNVARSILVTGAMLGMDVRIAAPARAPAAARCAGWPSSWRAASGGGTWVTDDAAERRGGRRRRLHRHLGEHGRAGRRLGRARSTAEPLPGHGA